MDTNKFVIFDYIYVNQVDFSQVIENSPETLRVSSLNRTFVKYNGTMPSSVNNIPNRSEELTYNQIKLILKEGEWLNPIPQ